MNYLQKKILGDRQKNARIRYTAPIISWVLGEPEREALRIAILAFRSSVMSRENWARTAEEPHEVANAKAQAMTNEETKSLLPFFKGKKNGILLTTIHMGDYLHAILAIATVLVDRKIFIVRKKNEDEVEKAVFEKLSLLGVQFEVIRTQDNSAGLKILRNLRRGAIVVMLFDLPVSFGETANVNIFNKSFAWVKGPAFYASLSEAYLIPFVAYRDAQLRPKFDLHPVIYSPRRSKAAEVVDIELICEKLAHMAELYVKEYPEQWLNWYLVPEMVATES